MFKLKGLLMAIKIVALGPKILPRDLTRVNKFNMIIKLIRVNDPVFTVL